MKIYLIIFFFFLTNITLPAQEAPSFTLQEAIDYAMEHSLDLKNAAVQIADAKQQIIEQRAVGLPKINAGVDYQYALELPVSLIPARFVDENAGPDEFAELQFGTAQNLTARVDLTTMIFDFTYFTGLKAAREFKKQKEVDYKGEQFNIKYEVIEAYLPTLIIQENIRILERNIENVQNLLRETTALYEEGFVEQLDVDRLELSLNNLQTEQDQLKRQSILTYNALKLTMGYPMDKELKSGDSIDELFIPADANDLSDPYSYEARPLYRSLQMTHYLNELNIQVNKSRFYPSFDGFLSYQQVGQGDRILKDAFWAPASQAGITMNVPLFDGLGRKAKVARARLNLDLVANNLRQLERVIDLEVENARQNYINALERLEDQKRNLRLAEKIYNTAKIKYQEGVGSSIELTQSEQSLYTAQQNHIQSKYDLLVAKMMLDKALGK